MKDKKLHMIGNAHLDLVWLWRWQEGFQEIKATFKSALDRMNEDKDFKFTCSSSICFEWIEKNNPEMFSEIKKRVEEGRIEIVGGWVVEPDCNIPSGESFVRQGLYGQRYFKEKFNKIAVTGYNVDSFGHNGNLPQILSKSGLKNYVFMRPMPNEKGIPGRIFWWKSNDGSKVLTYRLPFEYCTWGKNLSIYTERIASEFIEDTKELMFFYGVGNHGGGPTKENIKSIHELDSQSEEIKYEFSTTEKFFDSIREGGNEYPVLQDDLQHHASGSYSANSEVKRLNRKTENALVKSEKFSVFGKVLKNQPYPSDFEAAWKEVLLNQFHDTLAGTSLVSAYDDARNSFGYAMTIAEKNMNYGVQAISWGIDIEENIDMTPLVVFNPHSWASKFPIEIEARGLKENHKLLDCDGNLIETQLIQSESVTDIKRILFVADLPSMGYKVYKLYKNIPEGIIFENVKATKNTIENNNIKLVINEETGNIKSFYDKENDIEIFKREGARLSVIEDKSDTWSHNVFKFDNAISDMKAINTKLIEEGPVRSTIRVKYKFNDSYAYQDFRIYKELSHVEVKLSVDWREPLTMLKVKFPVNFNFRKPTYEIPFGYIEKNINGEEEPAQNWIDFTGEHFKKPLMYGLGIANDSKYSYSFDVDEMGITVLKNSPFAHHDPAILKQDVEYKYLDNGFQEMNYILLPHKGTWKNSNIVKLSQEINQKPVALFETFHKGELPQKNSFVEIDKENIILYTIKECEDKDGVILRFYETFKNETEATVKLNFMERELKLKFEPCEIKTVKIPYDKNLDYYEVNMLEWRE